MASSVPVSLARLLSGSGLLAAGFAAALAVTSAASAESLKVGVSAGPYGQVLDEAARRLLVEGAGADGVVTIDLREDDRLIGARICDEGDDVLLVAVTGWGQPEDRRRTSDAGFDRHLVKPPELAAIREICLELGEDAA